jgi:phosphoribosylanthranilate isomerase
MKPLIKVSGLTDLQDARYCAAMGVEFIGFNLQNTPPAKIREICAWLSGPKVVIEHQSGITDASLEELIQTLPFYAIESTDAESPSTRKYEYWQKIHTLSETQKTDSVFILPVKTMEEARNVSSYFAHLFLHFPTLSLAKECLASDLCPLGVYIGDEAYLEDGHLDYEALDILFEEAAR